MRHLDPTGVLIVAVVLWSLALTTILAVLIRPAEPITVERYRNVCDPYPTVYEQHIPAEYEFGPH